MSARLFRDDIQFLQRTLYSAGCYEGPVNGVWNATVDEAELRLESISNQIADRLGRFDSRSERNIVTLHPRAQEAARTLLAKLRAAGFDARVLSGTRTYAEQEQLYRIGRYGDSRKPVTNARAGASNHNFAIAWDIGLFDGGKYLTNVSPYNAAAKHIPEGVEWGGTWRTFRDPPHYQLALPVSLKEVRSSFELGRRFVNV
jgi:peptidoglycan L-alanyl-D-glutamate endopeptidase CwlK